jgi:hypothetical protein
MPSREVRSDRPRWGTLPTRGVRIGGALVSSPILVALVFAGACLLWAPPDDPPARAVEKEERDLVGAVTYAAETIRRHQTSEGYWTTAVTPGPAFQGPRTEVNVFTPAMIVDLLAPVAPEIHLADVLDRARGYLRRQIESTGLVRYHGDPGPIAASHRGCEIPPDADDTSLVWRIAPGPGRDPLLAARREIDRYRDSEGLYRTWLADDDAYRCFYVRYAGREWNPPDVVVDMHVYLFLAGQDAVAASHLCDTLRRRMDDDRIWVWYSVAPLLPLLREVDLARKGCSLQVPQRRIDRAVPGQEPYLTQSRLLKRLLLDDKGDHAARSSAESYLQALRSASAGGFAEMAKAPPLLYHNDLSAVPPHYHWSDDFGYALWLRLYAETARRFPGALPPVARPTPAR